MHDGRYWWLSIGFLLLSTFGTWRYLHEKSENEVKLAKGVTDALLGVWSIGSILVLAPRPGLHCFDIKIAIAALPEGLSLALLGAVLLLVSSKIAVAIVEARLARRRVREEAARRMASPHVGNTVLLMPRRQPQPLA